VASILAKTKAVYWAIRPECREWWMAMVRAVPGSIGIALRARVYGRRLGACGRGPVFQQHTIVMHPQGIRIGHRILVNRYAQMQGAGSITIGNNVMIGPGVMIWSINHAFTNPDIPPQEQGYVAKPVIIEDDVWIGAGSIVLPGAWIGRGCIIAAGSVVRGQIPAGSLAAGAPAVVKRRRMPPQVQEAQGGSDKRPCV
jgi:maltose O-acetyltransferase